MNGKRRMKGGLSRRSEVCASDVDAVFHYIPRRVPCSTQTWSGLPLSSYALLLRKPWACRDGGNVRNSRPEERATRIEETVAPIHMPTDFWNVLPMLY